MSASESILMGAKILFVTSVNPSRHPFVEQQLQLVKKKGCDVRVLTRVHSDDCLHPDVIYDGFLSREIPLLMIVLTIVKARINGAINKRFKHFIEEEAEWKRLGHKIGAKRAYHWMRIFKLVKEWKPDLIHVHFAWHLPFVLPLADYFSIPIVCTAHGSDIYFEDDWCNNLMNLRVKKIIAISESINSYMVRRCPDLEKKIMLIYNPINTCFLKPVISHPKTLNILNVAALSNVKNQAWLVRALAELKKRDIKFHCTFIGAGENYGRIYQQVKKLDLDGCVEFLGFLPHDEVLDAMDAASVFVLTSRSEGLPTVITEALARLCAVVATDLPGTRDATSNGLYGLLVPLNDDVALADAIEAADKSDDSVSRDAREWVSNTFKSEVHWNKLEAVYLSVLGN